MRRLPLFLVLIACMTCLAASDEIVVTQQDKKFSVTLLHAKVGDTIVFKNNDPYVHNIFSLSDPQSFDLGTFGKGEVRKLVLTTPGELEIECAVHPSMKLTIEVSK